MMAGRLRYVAQLQNPATTGDAYSTKSGYVDVAGTVRCSLAFLNGREIQAAKQAGSSVTVEIFCRPNPDITSASRLVIDGVTYEVEAIIPTSRRNRDWRLQCKVVS